MKLTETYLKRLQELSGLKLNESLIEEELLDETYEGQKDLEKLTHDILIKIGQKIIEQKYSVNPVERIVGLNTSFADSSEYSEIKEFIDDTTIKIVPTFGDIGGEKNVRGQLAYRKPDIFREREDFTIYLKYGQEDIDDVNYTFERWESQGYGEVTSASLYSGLRSSFYSTLLHELQHAYDAWRSKGKAMLGQSSEKYIKTKELAASISKAGKKNLDDFTPEEVAAIQNSYKAYQNLVHEINARFAQAMANIPLTSMDDNWKYNMKPWPEVYKKLIIYFDGWENLSDKMKKRLTQRLAKAYQEKSDNLKPEEIARQREFDKRFEKDAVNEGIKISKASRDILDDITDEKIGEEKYYKFEYTDELGGRAIGDIKTKENNKIATIIQMNSQPLGKNDDTLKRRGFFTGLLKVLNSNGINSVAINLQSSDTRKAVENLINKKILINPRNMRGVSVDMHPTLFDINFKNDSDLVSEIRNILKDIL